MGVDEETIRGFRNLLLKIFDEQKSAWSAETQNIQSKALECYYQCGSWKQISAREFENWLSSKGNEIEIDFSTRQAILILPPLIEDNEFVPILNLRCKLNRNQNSIRIYIIMVRLDEKKKLQGIGFRFESPEIEQYAYTENEDQANEGLHDFYHAQLITGFSYGPPVEIPNWLPVTQPSFPLPANDPITLVFALLLTFYGKKYCWEFYSKHGSNLPELSSRIEKMNEWIEWHP